MLSWRADMFVAGQHCADRLLEDHTLRHNAHQKRQPYVHMMAQMAAKIHGASHAQAEGRSSSVQSS